MALNRFMHPRNRYRDKKPDFMQLALKYPEFKELSSQDLSGKVTLDFKNPESVRVLTQTLLKEDFDLTVDLPNDRLVPTLSSRLNYIHWLEDMFDGQYQNLNGIDIGTGSSCIYPLLGCKLNNWSFLASEIDDKNFEYAVQNVKNNNMEDKITVLKVAESTGIPGPLLDKQRKYDFIMCNPPFFADHMEAQAVTTSRKADRPDPSSISTAEDCESIVQGGEAQFIKNMIQASFKLKDKIRIFTSMVGKKINVLVIKEELKRKQISNYSTTEFCQGKTMRWGIAWTFDESVKFPKSHFEKKKSTTALVYEIPFDNGQVLYDIQNITAFIITHLQQLKVEFKEGKRTQVGSTVTMTARENTWSHQRRKRRQEKFLKSQEIPNNECTEKLGEVNSDIKCTSQTEECDQVICDKKPKVELKLDDEKNVNNSSSAKLADKTDISNSEETPSNVDGKETNNNTSEIQQKADVKLSESVSKSETKSLGGVDSVSKFNKVSKSDNSKASTSSGNNSNYILKCRLILRKKDNMIELEVMDLDKTNREQANQILQYFKNKLKSQT